MCVYARGFGFSGSAAYFLDGAWTDALGAHKCTYLMISQVTFSICLFE